MNTNPIIEKYLESVRSNIYNLVESEKFISDLRQSIYEFAEGKDDLALDDIIEAFGTPDQVADEYLSGTPEMLPDNVEKSSRRTKILISLIVVGILITIGIFIWITHAPTDIPVYEMPIQQ